MPRYFFIPTEETKGTSLEIRAGTQLQSNLNINKHIRKGNDTTQTTLVDERSDSTLTSYLFSADCPCPKGLVNIDGQRTLVLTKFTYKSNARQRDKTLHSKQWARMWAYNRGRPLGFMNVCCWQVMKSCVMLLTPPVRGSWSETGRWAMAGINVTPVILANTNRFSLLTICQK